MSIICRSGRMGYLYVILYSYFDESPDTCGLAIRLAGWEKSRLEEIYTGHLLRMTLCDNGTCKYHSSCLSYLPLICFCSGSDPPSTLSKSRLEGFVKARISGHTDWKTFWMSLSLSTEFLSEERAYRSTSPVMSARSKHRVSNLFSRGHQNDTQTTGPAVPVISFYASPKPKDRKRPLLTLRDVTQVNYPVLVAKCCLIHTRHMLYIPKDLK